MNVWVRRTTFVILTLHMEVNSLGTEYQKAPRAHLGAPPLEAPSSRPEDRGLINARAERGRQDGTTQKQTRPVCLADTLSSFVSQGRCLAGSPCDTDDVCTACLCSLYTC